MGSSPEALLLPPRPPSFSPSFQTADTPTWGLHPGPPLGAHDLGVGSCPGGVMPRWGLGRVGATWVRTSRGQSGAGDSQVS